MKINFFLKKRNFKESFENGEITKKRIKNK